MSGEKKEKEEYSINREIDKKTRRDREKDNERERARVKAICLDT